MIRKWVLLLPFATGVIACVAAVSSFAGDEKATTGAGDQAKTPLQKIMNKMDDQTKAILKAASSAARFKKSGSGPEILNAAEELVKYGEETRKFTEPAETQKKPQKKWDEYTDLYIAAIEEMGKAARKKDFNQIRKAFKTLDSSCSNCHGPSARRPAATTSTRDDTPGGPRPQGAGRGGLRVRLGSLRYGSEDGRVVTVTAPPGRGRRSSCRRSRSGNSARRR